ncbi:hypothetical protein PAPYR_71 [Paratrimastix pyriformis]|uniref:Uncharacterized protein n=1 Tax=Paratrimastix pyriformis TaxID=342808 RepID=A0ABQ8UUS6_9EUKA|nr:hypothetical protein PAPYR_71 [Paratrimastix pyriformis]
MAAGNDTDTLTTIDYVYAYGFSSLFFAQGGISLICMIVSLCISLREERNKVPSLLDPSSANVGPNRTRRRLLIAGAIILPIFAGANGSAVLVQVFNDTFERTTWGRFLFSCLFYLPVLLLQVLYTMMMFHWFSMVVEKKLAFKCLRALLIGMNVAVWIGLFIIEFMMAAEADYPQVIYWINACDNALLVLFEIFFVTTAVVVAVRIWRYFRVRAPYFLAMGYMKKLFRRALVLVIMLLTTTRPAGPGESTNHDALLMEGQ